MTPSKDDAKNKFIFKNTLKKKYKPHYLWKENDWNTKVNEFNSLSSKDCELMWNAKK